MSDDLGYVIYSSLGSFYIPSAIMIFVYIRIYYAAKARANKGLSKKKGGRKNKKRKGEACTTPEPCPSLVATPTIPTSRTPAGGGLAMTHTPLDHHRSNFNEQTVLISKKVQICDIRVQDHSSSDPTPELATPDIQVCAPLRTLSARVDADHRNHNFKDENGLYLGGLKPNQIEVSLDSNTPSASPMRDCSMTASPSGTLRRDPSAPSVDGDQMSDMDPSSSDSGAMTRCSVMKPLKMRFCHPLIGKKINKPKREMIDMGRVSTPKAMRDPEKEKRRIARKKEKRATLILGLIMGSFIACWLPFFIMYILGPVTSFPAIAFDLAFWLGYMNSAFNPVIYTIFNKDFRRAFRKILFK